MYGLIFDIHDVLVDSHRARAQAWVEAHQELGFSTTFANVYSMIGHAPNPLLIQTIGLGINPPEGRGVFERFNTLFGRRFLPRIIAQFRATELVHTLRTETNLRYSIASVDPGPTILALLQCAKSELLYHTTTEAERAIGLYSDRELLKAAFERIGCPTNSTLVVTASPSQCLAAQQLNLQTIGITTTNWPANARQTAAATYECTADFLANWRTSPIFMLGQTPSA